MRTRPVAFGPGTVGPTMPLLALRRKDSDRTIPLRTPEIDQVTGQDRPKTLLLWPYRGRDGWRRPHPHANVRQIIS